MAKLPGDSIVPYVWLYFVGIFLYIGLKNRPYIYGRYLQSIGSWNGHWKVRQADDATMHWTSESRLRQLHASCLSATRELLDAFRAHRWLHSVGKTKWLILLRWCTRQTVLDVKVWWPQYTIDYRQLFDFEIARFNAKAGSISSRSGIFCLKKGVWRRCMACISSFLQHFPMSFTWVRGHSWAFRNVPVIEKCGEKSVWPQLHCTFWILLVLQHGHGKAALFEGRGIHVI